MKNGTLSILGCRGSFPMEGPSYVEFGGATSCYVLRLGEYAVVIDCGTGFCAAASALKGCTKVDILLTHLHYDHILGFLYPVGIPAEAETRLFVYTPQGQMTQDPISYIRPPFWPITPKIGTLCAACSDTPLQLHDQVRVQISPSNHPGVSAVVRIDTDEGSFCVICDWEHGAEPVPLHMTRGCDFIVYDGTFTDEEYAHCVGWGHSTWREGVKLAKERGIPRLLISHHAPDHTDAMLRQMEQMAKSEFAGTRFVRIEDQYNLRGERLWSGDMEFMWQAMKGSHYQRIMDQLAQTIHETDNFQEATSAALGTVIKAMHAQTGTLWLYDRFGSGRIYPKAVYGGADLSGMSLCPGEGIAGQVVECGSAVIIEDCQADARWASRVDSKTGFQTRTMICVPLSWKGLTFGCIQIINQRGDLLFDEKDLSFAERLAGEIAELLQQKGMLQAYIAAPESPKAAPKAAKKAVAAETGVSFQSIFCEGSNRDLDKRLRAVQEYAMLTAREQKQVLRICMQLRGYFCEE